MMKNQLQRQKLENCIEHKTSNGSTPLTATLTHVTFCLLKSVVASNQLSTITQLGGQSRGSVEMHKTFQTLQSISIQYLF